MLIYIYIIKSIQLKKRNKEDGKTQIKVQQKSDVRIKQYNTVQLRNE